MKKIFYSLVAIFMIMSCQVADETIRTEEAFVESDSEVLTLMEQTSMHDGSDDNILDKSSCYTVKLPVSVIVNGIPLTILSETDYASVEYILDDSADDVDEITFEYPIILIDENFTETEVHNRNQFVSLIEGCSNVDQTDDDIECIDFVYPIYVHVENTLITRSEDYTLNDDEDLNNLIRSLTDTDLVVVTYPISMILSDGSTVTANNGEELKDLINQHKDDCDEDDDNDYNDDDCIDCTPISTNNILTSCSSWYIDKLKLNNDNVEDDYLGYTFTFLADGTLEASILGVVTTGTWAAVTAGTQTRVNITFSTIPAISASWDLVDTNESGDGKKRVELESGQNELRFESDCN